jgi:translocation and assembly module TamB
VGGLKVTGQASQPKVAGEISIPPGTSKLSFKGNEFILTRGNINLDSKNIDTKVLLDFEGNSEVDKYQVFLSVKGEAKKPQIELTSEPYLSQEDILSLLTIGVTGDVSKDLRDEERSSLTALGVGTLIMEQLNFDKGLNSSLGLKLTVSPEFREDETSLIQGKSAVTNNAANKVKSATKIKLGKKLTKKIDLSVSSTVGGSLEQTQEMNINFNLTKKLSIEGGVEVRSTDQSSSVAPTSIGVDVKYKGSFK